MRLLYILLITLLLIGCSTRNVYELSPDIQVVNDKWNKIPYVKDTLVGRDDWKQPERFIREGGDCEDFAIAKYYDLVKNHDVKILIGHVRFFRQNEGGYHAVLLVDQLWVLDNNWNEIFSLPEYIQLHDFKIIGFVDHRRSPHIFESLTRFSPK